MTDLCSLEAKPLLTVDAALAKMAAAINPVEETELIAVQDALGRVLADPVYAAIHLPTERNAAMDGYAFASEDFRAGQAFTLNLAGTSWAGRPFEGALKPGQCVRIFTGAAVPEQADSVVMQEHVEVEGQTVSFPANTELRRNVRQAGEDFKHGDLLCAAPKKISAADMGLFAAAGIQSVTVKRKIKIGFFSTGDELVPVGQALQSGQIYDSNRYLLTGLLVDACYEVTDLGVVVDDKDRLKRTLAEASKTFDALISTGGASVGDADFVKQVLDELGEVDFWKIAIKPGKPLAFGSLGACKFFGLPGNPVAVMVTFQQIVAHGLRQLSGAPVVRPLRLRAVASSPLKKSAGREEYLRGILSQNENGAFLVTSSGRQGSHILSSMSKANCYIVLPAECAGINAGDTVCVEPFNVHCLTD